MNSCMLDRTSYKTHVLTLSLRIRRDQPKSQDIFSQTGSTIYYNMLVELFCSKNRSMYLSEGG